MDMVNGKNHGGGLVLTSVVWSLSVGYVFSLSLFKKLFMNVYAVCFIPCFIVKITMGQRSCRMAGLGNRSLATVS